VDYLFILTDFLPSYQAVLAKDANVGFRLKAIAGEWPETAMSSRAKIRAKSKMNGCSKTVGFGEKGVSIFYAHY